MSINEDQTAAPVITSSSAKKSPGPHLRKIRYLLAGGVGLMLPILVVLLYNNIGNVFSDALLYLVTLFSAVYLFDTLKKMLGEWFNFKQINLPIFVFFGSTLFFVSAALLALLILGHNALAVDIASASLVEQIFFYAALAGFFGLGTSISFISFELGNMEYTFLLLKVLRFAMLLLGLCIVTEVLGVLMIIFSTEPLVLALTYAAINLSENLVILAYGLNCLLLGFIFLLMAFRNPADMMREVKQ